MGDKWSQQSNFEKDVVHWGVVGFFEKPIVLKSGRQSYWYVNWRSVAEDVYRLDKVSDYILHFLRHLEDSGELTEIETIFGVPEGATKYSLLSQFKLARESDSYSEGSHVLSMGRGKKKEHGAPKDRFLLGQPRGRTVVVEDVTTTGASLIETINLLEDCGVEVAGAVALTNRGDGELDVKSLLESRERPVPYFAMSYGKGLLLQILEKFKGEGRQIGADALEEVNGIIAS